MHKISIISISGTPGVGKTDVAEILAKMINANLISINELIKKGKIPYKIDKKRKTKIIDTKILQRVINREIKESKTKNKTDIIEGHLSHFLKSDFVVILRANPEILKKRLKAKRWRKTKILENIQAEILDEITIEAIEKHKRNKIAEIDTSRKKPESIARTIIKILNNHSLQKRYSIGKINWMKKYYKMLE